MGFDMDSLVAEMLKSGMSAEDLAQRFVKALDAVDAANKSKKEKAEYCSHAAGWLDEALDEENFTMETAAKVAMLAAAARYPDLELKQLKEYENSTKAALEQSLEFYHDITSGNINHAVDSLLDGLFPKKEKKENLTDDEKLKRFIDSL